MHRESIKVLRVLIVEDTPERQKILCNLVKEHAWVLVHTAHRGMVLLSAYDFDLILLDYDLAGDESGADVALCLSKFRNKQAKVIIHSMNALGAEQIHALLPEADLIPLSKITKNNLTFKRLQEELRRGTTIDWEFVFSGRRK
jgi:DNA-binding response OmpR family regulator